ncbi:2-polyprenyl-6-methoxyphenol hydroxylase-like FAD-dependent oxidoreductase [Nocardioides thalensis]|uniref:2-polyprenyl-6-methoxyphenol hydroxylase-like FAD-dependent oxidoreductase n=1 Tax=Nocardioides thalensis TaxID=1914755 RepID=A0A853C3H2_9ACTN|nr:FAD-dependent oxidoreductase [Nocardioides thalensis]NYJ00853.1 2-polyprenyl-6-methoxyphenol hydroxylase-like FAD-dependent oxidoreductase [Nocardioides thalensis]
MKALVIGAGPVGTFAAIGLARRGHEVVVVDRDPGPAADGSWHRAGVMQGVAPHAWRGHVVRAMQEEMPDVVEALCAAGARIGEMPGMPGLVTAMFARRPLVERVLRETAQAESTLRWITGHAESLLLDDQQVRGVVVDGDPLWGDVVVVATGRAGRLGDELRGPSAGGSCGTSYIFRTYRTRPDVPAFDSPFPSFAVGPGYASLVMPADNRTHHVLLICPSDAAELPVLRTADGFEGAAAAVPHTAPWADPAAHQAITDVQVGGNLTNTYRLQGPALGLPPAEGLYYLGDSVCTLNPANGRSLALHVPHAKFFLDHVDGDPTDVSLALDQWAEEHIRPWWADHVVTDASLLRRFHGEDVSPDEQLPSDVIAAAAALHPEWMPIVGPFGGMFAGPEVLDQLREPVAQMLRDGWLPPIEGPARESLVPSRVGT